MKMSVVYFSASGNTQKMAECIAAGANSVEGVEAKAFPIDAIDEAFGKESKSWAAPPTPPTPPPTSMSGWRRASVLWSLPASWAALSPPPSSPTAVMSWSFRPLWPICWCLA